LQEYSDFDIEIQVIVTRPKLGQY